MTYSKTDKGGLSDGWKDRQRNRQTERVKNYLTSLEKVSVLFPIPAILPERSDRLYLSLKSNALQFLLDR